MIKADRSDKKTVVDILSQSFDDNKSVNYILPQDALRTRRLSRLMEYSFDYCLLFGEVWLSGDKSACVLLITPRKKRSSFRSILLDIRLIIGCIGLSNVQKAMRRETLIQQQHPANGQFIYCWFIGVLPSSQHRGIGTQLMKQLIDRAGQVGLPVYLETSMERNLPWYQKLGFTIYQEMDFDYRLYCLKFE